MLTAEAWGVALLVATAVHAGFQLTVSRLVYPALAAVAPAAWEPTHAAHSRRITPLVGLVYGLVMVTAVGSLASGVTAANAVAGALRLPCSASRRSSPRRCTAGWAPVTTPT